VLLNVIVLYYSSRHFLIIFFSAFVTALSRIAAKRGHVFLTN